MSSVYDAVVLAGCEIDSHESDLYVRATPEAVQIVADSGRSYSRFVSQIDGRVWLEVPFAFEPWWEARLRP